MAKRPLEEFDVSTVAVSPNAKVHGVVSCVSPMKRSKTCSYFDGEVTDGKNTMRLFGFDGAAGVRRKLVEFEGKPQAISLSACEVKKARQGDRLEILVGKGTHVEVSDKVFDVGDVADAKLGKKIRLDQLSTTVQFQRVTVAVKAIHVKEPMEIAAAGGKKKQDIVVADKSATGRVTVWENEIGVIKEQKSYKLGGMVVREYRGQKFLSTSKEKSHIELIEDIGEVQSGDEEEEESVGSRSHIKNARILGVLEKNWYCGCLKCGAKVLADDEEDDIGKCVKCQMTQCIEGCQKQLSVRVVIGDGSEHLTLCAFGQVVLDIVEKSMVDEVSERVLLKAKPFCFVHHGGIIQSISRRK